MCGVWRGYDVAGIGGGEFTLRLVPRQKVAPLYWRSDTHTHTDNQLHLVRELRACCEGVDDERPPGAHERHTRHDAWPPVANQQRSCRGAVGDDMWHTTVGLSPPSNLGRHAPRCREPHEQGGPPEAAAPWPDGPCDRRDQTNLRRERRPGGCTRDKSWTTSRGCAGVCGTICVAANPRDRWESSRAGANEPAVIHCSSFVEEEGGNGLGSFLIVPT